MQPKDQFFFDLCCGSGAVSIALIDTGFDPSLVHMVDCGPWGVFWEQVGNGSFDLPFLKTLCDAVPEDRSKVRDFIKELAACPFSEADIAPVFLLLQAAAFGGTPVSIKEGKWVVSGWRNLWMSPDGKRKVNPMMPLPQSIYERTLSLTEKMYGVKGSHSDVSAIIVPSGSVVYIDPPYENTACYSAKLDVLSLVRRIQGSKVFVSEALALSENALRLSGVRPKGGINGKRKIENAIEEWISIWP